MAPLPPLAPCRAAIAYSRANHEDRKALDVHLATLKRNGWINVWHDHEIPPGADYLEEIDKNLHIADLIVLLLSADFLNSDACRAEMAQALARHDNRTALVVPVILGPCGWQ